jgi:hypothetical protein
VLCLLDVIVFGTTLQEHNARLREVLEMLRQYNLKIQPDKSEFLKTEFSYLGHVTSEGVRPDSEKIKAITNLYS